METYRKQALQAISTLLTYPKETYIESAEVLYVVLQSQLPEAAKSISDFANFIDPQSVHELEELYARTFDVNPMCALEVGWHLFGEDYARGSLLVKLRSEMRHRGIEESSELPDHIAHVLSLISVMSDEEAKRFVHACVMPALAKMQKALDDAGSPYRLILRCLVLVLENDFGKPTLEEAEEGAIESIPTSPDPTEGGSNPFKDMPGDPLRDYPSPGGGAVINGVFVLWSVFLWFDCSD